MALIRQFLRFFVYGLIVLTAYLLSRAYKLKNIRKKKLLIYTDSRGFEITGILNRRNQFSSYARYFIKHYDVDYYISPERHTTTLDFLELYERKSRTKTYDFVILHTGVVDFSPRPLSALQEVYRRKECLYRKYFRPQAVQEHLTRHFNTCYEGEWTNNLYSLEMAEHDVLPRLNRVEGLVWISCNRVLSGWEGNYHRTRPRNMGRIDEYNELFIKSLKHTIDLSKWTDQEIMQYTCDNIHFTESGMIYLEDRLVDEIRKLQC